MKWTRRQAFLGAGAATVAGCAPTILPAQDADVLILGAGLSGLRAAMLLNARGVKVTVLEGQERVGGRLHTLDHLPGRPEAGGIQIGKGYRRIREAADTVGVRIIAPPEGTGRERTMIFRGDVFSTTDWATHPGNPFPEQLKRSAPDSLLFALSAPANPIDDPANWRDAARSSDVAASAFLAQAGLSEEARALCDIALNANNLDTYSMINVWRSLALYRLDSAAGPSDVVEGGSQRLPEAMAGSLPAGSVRLGVRIKRIEEGRGGVVIETDQGQFRAPYVICTLPFPALRAVGIDAPIDAVTQTAIQNLPYTQVRQIHLAIEKMPADGLPLSMWTDTPIERVFPQQAPDGEVVGMKVWINGDGAIGPAKDQELFEFATSILAEKRGMKVRPLEVARWDRDQAMVGGAYMHWAPGTITPWADNMGAPTARLHFAGEHLSFYHTGMEGAMETADRAADSVLTKLSA
ncbi:MAG: NAD(P)/FAD-dependent oxidoreductase [Pseudomonadota bacterium]